MVYEARPKTGSLYVMIALCLALSLIGWVALGVIPSASTRDHGTYPFTGALIVLACLGAAYVFWRRARDTGVQVRADERGLFVPAFSPAVISWDRIRGYRCYDAWMRGVRQELIRFSLDDPDSLPRTGGFRDAVDALDRRMSFGDFGINTSWYDRGMADLLAALRHYRPDLSPA